MPIPSLAFEFYYSLVGKKTFSFNLVPRNFSIWGVGLEVASILDRIKKRKPN